jgi:hypothetical protein
MKLWIALAYSVAALATTLSASTIDVSSNSSQLLQNGDSLEFLFSAASYANYATQMGTSPYPDSIDFVFSSLPVNTAGEFTVEIASFSGAASVSFAAPLSWTVGYSQNSQYTGATSAIVGLLDLSDLESQSLFSSPYADLVLTYSGPTITVGNPGYTLPHDLTVSLLGDSMSIGAMVYTAGYESASSTGSQYQVAGAPRVSNALSLAPEPAPRLLVIAGIALCAFAGILKRLGSLRYPIDAARG